MNSLDGDVSFYLNGANPFQGGAVVKGAEVFAVHFNLQHVDEICRSMHNLCIIWWDKTYKVDVNLYCVNCALADLIGLRGSLDDNLEGLPLGKGHGMKLLWAPGAILKSVEDHLVLAIKSGVEVKSDVTGLGLSTAQIDRKPVGQI